MRHIVALVAFLFANSALAEDIPTELQVKLQGAMLSHIQEILVDGAYTYVDGKDQAVKTVYPANVHPMIVPFGKDYFLCSEMVDESGNNLTADFLVRQVGGEYKVVQTIMNDRPTLMAALAKLGK
jgi:hypothetical protein